MHLNERLFGVQDRVKSRTITLSIGLDSFLNVPVCVVTGHVCLSVCLCVCLSLCDAGRGSASLERLTVECAVCSITFSLLLYFEINIVHSFISNCRLLTE